MREHPFSGVPRLWSYASLVTSTKVSSVNVSVPATIALHSSTPETLSWGSDQTTTEVKFSGDTSTTKTKDLMMPPAVPKDVWKKKPEPFKGGGGPRNAHAVV